MPLVVVTAHAEHLDDFTCRSLGKRLQEIVSEAMSTSDGGALPDEIEVRFKNVDPRTIGGSPFSVLVVEHDHPERRENIERRAQIIARELRVCSEVPTSVIDDRGGHVWILLAHGSFEAL
jgi:hypothetical protein